MKKSVLRNIFVAIFCVFVMGFGAGCDLNEYFTETAGHACSHEYNIEYIWQDYASCKAKASCKKCEYSIEEVGVISRSTEPTKYNSCTDNEEYTWTAVFTNELFESSTKIETTKTASHNYKESEITWAKDLENNEYCRMKLTCEVCNEVETLTTYNITTTTTDATCTQDGKIEYIAHFENGKTATKNEIIPKSHSYTIQYIWNKAEDKILSCEAKKICSKCSTSSEKHELSLERILVENMQKENVEGGFRYIADFKTAELETQYSEVLQNNNPADDPSEPDSPTNPCSNYITYTATKVDEETYDIYFNGTCVFDGAACIIEENVFKIIGCNISFDVEKATYFPAEESPIEFEISSQNGNDLTIKFVKKTAAYVLKTYTLTATAEDGSIEEYNSYIEFYSDSTATLFVNLAENIYVPFQIFPTWTKTGDTTIQIDYNGELLEFEVEVV